MIAIPETGPCEECGQPGHRIIIDGSMYGDVTYACDDDELALWLEGSDLRIIIRCEEREAWLAEEAEALENTD